MIRWARDVEPEPVSWAYDGYLPRRVVTLLAGSRNAGKTLVGLWFARELSLKGDCVWINTGEDALASVIRPRLEVTGADLSRIRVSAEPFRFPGDLDEFEDQVVEERPDLIVLDSLQRHVPRYQQAVDAIAAMEGLGRIAEDYELSVLVVSHFTKSKGGSVEVAIGGTGAVQNGAKCILVVGPAADGQEARIRRLLDPTVEADRTLAVACERIGIADLPETLILERRTARYEPTNSHEPFLELVATSTATAATVLAAARSAAQAPAENETKIAMAAEFLFERLSQGPSPTKVVEEDAKAAGRYFSRNTFDRARSWLPVRSVSPAELKAEVGATAYAALSDDDKLCWWMALPHSPSTPTLGGPGGPQGGNL